MAATFKDLLEKYKDGSLSLSEKEEFSSMLRSGSYEKELEEAIDTDWNLNLKNVSDPETLELIYQQILINKNEAKVVPFKKVNPFRWKIAAAILIIVLSSGAYLFFNRSHTDQIAVTKNTVHDIAAPKFAKASLKLADGTIIYLDSAGNGTLAKQQDVDITKQGDGQIIYSGTSNEISFNILTNPRGSKAINVILSDGSKVWLNAESSLKYPTAFIGNERKVEIIGEAYFEVEHNAAMPFKVKKADAEVTVLGTHFNVNAYENEKSINVTLLEGSVKVSKGSEIKLISPGQQAQVTNEQIVINRNADVEQVMAWKNGLFNFNKTEIGAIMQQMERWYNMDVEYEGVKPQMTLSGIISRNINASKVLEMLELSGVHFRIEGNKIIVSK